MAEIDQEPDRKRRSRPIGSSPKKAAVAAVAAVVEYKKKVSDRKEELEASQRVEEHQQPRRREKEERDSSYLSKDANTSHTKPKFNLKFPSTLNSHHEEKLRKTFNEQGNSPSRSQSPAKDNIEQSLSRRSYRERAEREKFFEAQEKELQRRARERLELEAQFHASRVLEREVLESARELRYRKRSKERK